MVGLPTIAVAAVGAAGSNLFEEPLDPDPAGEDAAAAAIDAEDHSADAAGVPAADRLLVRVDRSAGHLANNLGDVASRNSLAWIKLVHRVAPSPQSSSEVNGLSLSQRVCSHVGKIRPSRICSCSNASRLALLGSFLNCT